MTIEYGCYVDPKNNPPRCKICCKILEIGQGFARVFINAYADPYFHDFCLFEVAEKSRQEGNKRKQYESDRQHVLDVAAKASLEGKAKTAKIRSKTDFRIKILKDCLKAHKVKVSKLSITQYSWAQSLKFGDIEIRLAKHLREKLIQHMPIGLDQEEREKYWNRSVIAEFELDKVTIKSNPTKLSKTNYMIYSGRVGGPSPTKPKTICLADPNSFKQLGDLMMECSKGIFGEAGIIKEK